MDTHERILQAASHLFAQRGYEGASVRTICKQAGANMNAVSYHFGGKRNLYQKVIERGAEKRSANVERLLATPPRDRQDFEARILLFAEEVLVTHLEDPDHLNILFAEFQQGFRNCDEAAIASLKRETDVLVAFLTAARRRRLLRKGVDLAIMAGGLSERLHNSVRYAETIHNLYGVSIKDPKYRRHWTQQVVDMWLHGTARPVA